MHSKIMRVAAALGFSLALATFGGTAALASCYDFDLRWDGSTLLGSHLLNPAELHSMESGNLTISAQSDDDKRIWEVQYVKPEENGLTGGIVIGGVRNTFAYGVAGGRGPIGLGASVQRTGWGEDEYEYSANLGVMASAGILKFGAAGRFPFSVDGSEAGDGEGELTAGLGTDRLGLSAGYVTSEQDPRVWAGVTLSPIHAVSIGYATDFLEDGSASSYTTSLKVGVYRYLIATLKRDEELDTDEYALAIGATF